MIDDVGEPFLLHHLLLMCAGVAREVLRHWITNMPRRHCYLVSKNPNSIQVRRGINVEIVNRK